MMSDENGVVWLDSEFGVVGLHHGLGITGLGRRIDRGLGFSRAASCVKCALNAFNAIFHFSLFILEQYQRRKSGDLPNISEDQKTFQEIATFPLPAPIVWSNIFMFLSLRLPRPWRWVGPYARRYLVNRLLAIAFFSSHSPGSWEYLAWNLWLAEKR